MYTSREVYEYISHRTNDPIVEWKVCKISGESFAIYQSDLEFYTKISPSFGGQKFGIATPTLCPEERQRRRLMFRNERKLYKRKCDFSGKDIISIYSPEKPYKVYDQKIWRGDAWDPMEYGREFNFSRSFTEQFGELQINIPCASRIAGSSNENSDYVNFGARLKNCYRTFTCEDSSDCMFANYIIQSHNCVDSYNCFQSTNCYNSIDLKMSSFMFFCSSCEGCSNCYNCDKCIGCDFCIGSSNLTNKKYYIHNKQTSKELFEQYLGQQNQQNNKILQKISTINNINASSCIGDFIINSSNCKLSFDIDGCQNCSYSYQIFTSEDCYDSFVRGGNSQLIYDSQCIGNRSYSILFCSNGVTKSSNMLYCNACQSCSFCFGCIGLRNKSYCIFNKQYSKEEYETTVSKIIAYMQETGEWGEFFDPTLSPFCYNETVAQEYFPLTRGEALAKGYNRMDKEYPVNIPPNMQTIDAHQLPSNIDDVQDTILEQAIICEVSGKPYRIVKPELAFYRKHKIAIPRKHPDVRHSERMQLRPGRTLFLRNCDCCSEEMLSVYSQDHEGKVYCESCYQKEVYG